MTLQDLADAAALSKGHLSSIESGIGLITIETIGNLARALDVPPMCVVAVPAEDERVRIVNLVCKLPKGERKKFQRELEARTTRK